MKYIYTTYHFTTYFLKRYTYILCLGILVANQGVFAQADFNMTQFQNTPFLSNPAMIASRPDIQFFVNYRNQPNATTDDFGTTMVTGLYPFMKKGKEHQWGAIGASFVHDNAGEFIKTNAAMLALAYNLQLGNTRSGAHFLSFGMQGGYFRRRVSLDGLTTSSQVDPTGQFDPSLDFQEPIDNDRQTLGLLSTGLYWYQYDQDGDIKAFLGASLYNFNTPQTAFFNNTSSNLPNYYNFIGGVRLLNRGRFHLMPNFRIINRARNNEVLLGSWLNYDLFTKKEDGFFKNGTGSIGLWYDLDDAFVAGLQWEQPRYLLTLTFDLPTANTSDVWQGNTAFEVTFGLKFPRKKKRVIIPVYPVEPTNFQPSVKPDLSPQLSFQTLPNPPKAAPEPRTKPGLEDGAFRFKFNSSNLDDRSRALLDSVAQVLTKYPTARIEISGHTCNIGNAGANLELSRKRAEAVRGFLLEYEGVDQDRITVKAYGETRPLVPNTSEPNRIQNRRVAFKLRFPEGGEE